MHDQVAALKWVNMFISHFGGNKDNVTIMGESAGAMSCFLHYVSPLSKGLFHKVIALSGSASTPFMHNDRQPSLYARTFAKSFGMKFDDSPQSLVEQLQSISAKDLVIKSLMFKDWDSTFPLPWKPVVDNYASLPFMPLSFEDALKSGNFDKTIPILAGTMGEEGLIVTAPFHKSSKRWELLFRQWEKWAPQLFFNRETELITENDIEAVDKVFEHFFPVAADKCLSSEANRDPKYLRSQTSTVDEDAVLLQNSSNTSSIWNKYFIPPLTENNLKQIEEIITTSWFHAPLHNDLEKLVKAGVNAYSFKFCYQGTFSIVDVFRLSKIKMGLNFMGRYIGAKFYRKKIGTCHGDDLVYIFPMKKLPKPLTTVTDVEISSLLTLYVTNFAKFGNPTPQKEDDDVRPLFTWPNMSSCNNEIVIFEKDGDVVIGKDKDEQRNKFWNQLTNQISLTTSNKHIEKLHSKIAEFRVN